MVWVLSMSGCWPVRDACPHSAYLCVQARASPDCILSLLAQIKHVAPAQCRFTYDVYNRNDIERILGKNAWAISFKDSACRCFGYMVAKTRYVFTIDDDCFVAEDPKGQSEFFEPVFEHAGWSSQ